MRRKTIPIKLGNKVIGGDAPVLVQSMTNTKTHDAVSTVSQIRELEKVGCEAVRVAVPDRDAVHALPSIKSAIQIPLIADVHFRAELALAAMEAGVDGLRINPGNIGSMERVRAIVEAAKENNTVIRIGVNAGSLEKDLLRKYGGPCAEAMVESALGYIRQFEDWGFKNFKVSLKASDVDTTVASYRLLAEKVPYPLHLGITEAGTLLYGAIKSAIGLGILLAEGVGDTIRVSLAGDPVPEVQVAYMILRALDLRCRGVEIVACPTCGRCHMNVTRIAAALEERLAEVACPLTVAVMGCEVNGPGEARQADIGVAGGRERAVIFQKGKIVDRVPQDQVVEAMVERVKQLCEEEGQLEG